MTPRDRATAEAFRLQIGWCRQDHAAPFTAEVIAAVLRDFEAGGAWRRLLADWPGDPVKEALSLRAAGALHRLALKGVEPFAGIYARLDRDPAVLDEAARLAGERPEVAGWLANPPQTNETQRSAVLAGGFLEIVRAQGLPLRLLEMGCSAGLNLAWDRYRLHLGDTWLGPEESPVRLEPAWEGPSPAPVEVRIASRRGADQLPVDLADPEQRVRLLSYVWAEQAERVARLRAALALAAADPPPVERADAADWVEAQLADLPRGVTTVLYHSYVWLYLPERTKARIRRAIEAAGERAGPDAGLAWLSFEGEDVEAPTLDLVLWPDGGRRRLARAHPHGRWVAWDAQA